MNTLSLNIGLNIGNAGKKLDVLSALHAIADHLPATEVKAWFVRIHPLTDEPTLVVRCATRIAGPQSMHLCIHDLSLACQQDCIAGKLAIHGEAIHEFLTGPNTAPYGNAFDEKYWLPVTCDNAPQPIADTLANLFANICLQVAGGGWTAAQTAKAISDGDTNAAKLVLDGLFGPDVQRAEILLGELTDGDLVAEAKRRIRDRAAAGELPALSTD